MGAEFFNKKIRNCVSLENLSLSHDDLRDLWKPLDDLADNVMDDAVDCAAEIFSECMDEPERNMILIGI